MVKKQWGSIENGIKSEKLATDTFTKKFGGKGTIITYPPGAKMDRYHGVDITYNGQHLQVKPLKYFNKDTLTVTTYGMLNYIGKLPELIVFINNTDILVFKNENYIVNSRTSVTFNDRPLRINALN